MTGGTKRKPEIFTSADSQSKRQKYSKFKSTNRGNDNALSTATIIESGTTGIWATCVRGLEAKATAQLREVLDEYAKILYPDVVASHESKTGAGAAGSAVADDATEDGHDDDLEAAIKAEVKEAKDSSKSPLFRTVRIDIACVLYFVVDAPMDPVTLVQRICNDAAAGTSEKRTRHVNRLTPMTLMGQATSEGIAQVARKVLAPHFHEDGVQSKSFAIRTTIRNQDELKRDDVIKQIADLVGSKHTVNLSKPDAVILVDIYRMKCGMSVVSGSEYEELKRYNVNELYALSGKREAASAPTGTDAKEQEKA